MKGKIFNTQEVQAIIAGNKTMFREVIKAQPNSEINPVYLKECNSWQWATKESRRECPYQVGQKIFCKESFDYREHYSIGNYDHYTAWKKRPASKMKQEHSRLTLQITSIGVERLAEISNVDCKSEGEDQWSFICNWNATHKKPEEKFEANPFVWVVDFKINK